MVIHSLELRISQIILCYFHFIAVESHSIYQTRSNEEEKNNSNWSRQMKNTYFKIISNIIKHACFKYHRNLKRHRSSYQNLYNESSLYPSNWFHCSYCKPIVKKYLIFPMPYLNINNALLLSTTLKKMYIA